MRIVSLLSNDLNVALSSRDKRLHVTVLVWCSQAAIVSGVQSFAQVSGPC